MPGNYVPLQLPAGSRITNPTITDDAGNLLFQFYPETGELKIGVNDPDPLVTAFEFYATDTGEYSFGFGGSMAFSNWRFKKTGLYIGADKLLGVVQVGPVNVDTLATGGADLEQCAQAINALLTALRAHGLIT